MNEETGHTDKNKDEAEKELDVAIAQSVCEDEDHGRQRDEIHQAQKECTESDDVDKNETKESINNTASGTQNILSLKQAYDFFSSQLKKLRLAPTKRDTKENRTIEAGVESRITDREQKEIRDFLDTDINEEKDLRVFHRSPSIERLPVPHENESHDLPPMFNMSESIEQVTPIHKALQYFKNKSQSFRQGNSSHRNQAVIEQLVHVGNENTEAVRNGQGKGGVSRTFERIKTGVDKIKSKLSRKGKETSLNTMPDRSYNAKKSTIFVTDSFKTLPGTKDIVKHDICNHESINTIYPLIGACVIAFPYALKAAGFPLGVLLLICVAIVVDYSQVLLQHCSIMANKASLQDIMRSVFSTPGTIASYVLPTMYSMSVLVTYNLIIGDCLTKVVNSFFRVAGSKVVVHRRVIITIVTAVIVLPLSMLSNIKRVVKWSYISLISATLVTVFVCVKLFTMDHIVPHTQNAFRFLNTNLIQAIAVTTFAFSCQHQFRLSFNSIAQPPATKNTSSNRKETEASVVTSYSLLCTLTLAICGYLTFKSVTQGDLLENYCEEDIFASICRLFFATFVLCLYPLECHSIRHLFHRFIGMNPKIDILYHISLTFCLILVPYILSLAVDCLSLVLELSGLLFGIPLIFIVPAACYIQLSPGSACTLKKLPCLICMTVGLICTICGLVMAIFTSHQCVHNTKLFPYCNGSTELLGPLITMMSLNGTWDFDPEVLGFNPDFEDNVTDLVAAYFNRR